MTNYPAQIDTSLTLPIVSSNVTPGPIFNLLRDAVVAIETELGIKPSGINTTVRARLDYLEFLLGALDPVQIGQDLGGTSSAPIVIGIQGNPISNVAPNFNDVLTWNGIAWEPKANSGGGGTGGPGPQGSPGATGPAGNPGAPGATGTIGPQGNQGSPGATGTQGNQGSPGATGAIGPQGNQGSPGVTGLQGSPGATGTQGIQGSPGVTGTQGPQGSPGLNGVGGNSGVYVLRESATLGLFNSLNFHGPGVSASATGTVADIYIVVSASGTQGAQGSPGATGVTGPQGNQGSPGVTGTQGIQGSPGVTGTIGPQGNQGSPGVTGFTGAQGSPGVTGAQGIQGIQGSPGVTGFTGAQGSPGVTGSQGIQGSPGVTGTQGPTGSIGPQGNQGSPGVTGTIGPQGNQGSPGVTGLQGSPGVTGAQGIQGSPGVTGFTGAQGSPGVTGPQGSPGVTGVQGVQGAQGFQGSPGMNTNRYIIPDALTTFAWPLDGPTGSTSFANIATGMSAAMNIPTGGTNFTAGRAGLFNEGLRITNTGWIRTTFENDLNISSTSFTISAWVRPRALQGAVVGNNWGRVITKWFTKSYTTVAPDAFAIILNNSDNIVYVSCNNSGASKETAKVALNTPILNQWNHITVTYNAGTVSIWLNGNLNLVDTTFPATINFNGVTGGAWSIGGTPTGTTYITDAEIDDVRVESATIRGATYIVNMYQAGAYGNGGVLTGIQGSPGVTGPNPLVNGLFLGVKNINQATYTVAIPDHSLNINTGSPVSIIFSSATSMGTGYVFCIADDTFNADANNISIRPSAADLLDNSTGVSSLITKGGAWTYQSNGVNKWKRIS